MSDTSFRPVLSGQKALVIGVANDDSIAYGCAKAFRTAGAELAISWFGDAESGSFVARGCQRSGVAGAKAAWVVDMPISSNEFGFGVALLFVSEARSLTAFSPKKRCPFQFVPVIALATRERLR